MNKMLKSTFLLDTWSVIIKLTYCKKLIIYKLYDINESKIKKMMDQKKNFKINK